MLFKKDNAAIGIGTLIIFIAMILVAGMAASILIETMNNLEQTALKSGQVPNETPNWGEDPVNLYGKLHLEVDGESKISRIKSEPGDYRDYYRNIYNYLIGEAHLDVKPEQARDVIKIIELAQKSSREGHRVYIE